MREIEEVIKLKDLNAVENEEKESGIRTLRAGNKGNRDDNFAKQNSIFSLIYQKNVICPTALYLFKECSVLCMPFAELGQSVYFLISTIFVFFYFLFYLCHTFNRYDSITFRIKRN